MPKVKKCPHCNEETLLVAIVTDFYKCTLCGQETRQYVNGSIKYLKLDDRDREFIQKEKEINLNQNNHHTIVYDFQLFSFLLVIDIYS